MSSSPEAIHFDVVQPALSLFAEAVAGVVVPFEIVEPEECWPHRPSASDESLVRVPAIMSWRTGYRCIVLQQIQTQPSPIAPAGHSRLLFGALYPIVEDHRVHAATRRLFPGAVADLHALLTQGYDQLGSDGSPRTALRRYSLGHQPLLGALAGAEQIVDQVCASTATPLTSAQVTNLLCGLLAAGSAGQSIDELLGELHQLEDELGLPSEGPTSVSLDGGDPSEFHESERLGGGHLLGEGHEQLPTSALPDEAEDSEPLGLDLQFGGVPDTNGDLRTYLYDEWDYHQQTHRRAWCRVIEEHLVGDDHGFIGEVRARHQGLRSRLRRTLSNLRTEQFIRVHRCDDGEELDLDAAIEHLADRRSGAPSDERLHTRRDRAARDIATVFLVDLSASTSSPAVPPEPRPVPEIDPMDDPLSYGPIWGAPVTPEPVRRVIDVAKEAVALMGDALHELGDRYAIYGFSGSGRESVEFKIGKDFSDRVSPKSWASVAAMKPLRYTRMGPAVRHAAAKLLAEPARTRLLFVVSDGYPQDTDYGRDRHDREYGLRDTARALADANQQGIETFCVTIDPAGHDYLRTMCPDERYLVIDDVESLPEALASAYLGRFHTVRRVESALPA